MEENIDNNKILESIEDLKVFEFKYNFINTPWDDRSKQSKLGIIALLVAIFVATMACVINNFRMHFREYDITKNATNSEMNCFRVKIEENPFVARIHSMWSREPLCVGAVVSATSILANGVCVKSGPIRVQVGSPTQPHCRKGFRINVIETIYHESITSNKLALLSSYDDIAKCSTAIKIDQDLNWDEKAYIIGRPLNMGRALSRQLVTLVKKDDVPMSFGIKHLKLDSMICVKDLARCPVRAGDLLVQNDKLYGIFATSVQRTDENDLACFADLRIIRTDLKELDAEINK